MNTVKGNDGALPKALVDEARMQNLVENLEDGLWDVIESFLDDAPRQIAAMQAAFTRGDLDDLQRRAHSMKSSSGIFGAKALVDLCLALEVAARNGSESIEALIQAVSHGYEDVHPVLKTYLPAS